MNTERFYLKEIEPSDIHWIHKGLSNPNITKFYDVHFDTMEDTKVQMDWYETLKTSNTGLWWGIYDKKNDDFCGAGGLNAMDHRHKRAEVGLWLLEEHWGRGILKEVMPSIFNAGFERFELNRIEGFVVHQNEKCKRALEKIQFKHEGTMRSYELKDGAYIDVDIFAILRKDWQQYI